MAKLPFKNDKEMKKLHFAYDDEIKKREEIRERLLDSVFPKEGEKK